MEEKNIATIRIEKKALQSFVEAVRGIIDNDREYMDTIKILIGIQKDSIPFYESMQVLTEKSQKTIETLSMIIGNYSSNEENKRVTENAQSNIMDLKNFGDRLSNVKEGSSRLCKSFSGLEISVANMESKLKPLLDILQKFDEASK